MKIYRTCYEFQVYHEQSILPNVDLNSQVQRYAHDCEGTTDDVKLGTFIECWEVQTTTSRKHEREGDPWWKLQPSVKTTTGKSQQKTEC